MATFAALFNTISGLNLDQAPIDAAAIGWPDRILGLSGALNEAGHDARKFDKLRLGLLRLWLYQSPVRLSTFLINDAQGYAAIHQSRGDKTVCHIDTRADADGLSVSELRGESETWRVHTTQDFYKRLRTAIPVTDYELTGVERQYTEACGAIWCSYADALSQRPIIEGIGGSSKGVINLFLRGSADGTQPGDDAAAISDVIRRTSTVVGRVAGFGETLTWIRAPFTENLRRYSFFDYVLEQKELSARQDTLLRIDDAQGRGFTKPGPDGIWTRDAFSVSPDGFTHQLGTPLMPMVVQSFSNVRVFGPACNIATNDGKMLCIARAEDYQITTPLGNSEPEAMLDGDLEFCGRHGHYFSASYAMKTRRLEGPAVMVGMRWKDTFGHVAYDMVPRLMCLDVLADVDVQHFVIGGPAASWYIDLLVCCGIERSRIVEVGKFAIEFAHIYVAGKAGSVEAGFGNRVFRFYDPVIERVLQQGTAISAYGFPKRVFISRRNRSNDRRALVNGAAFRRLLQQYDVHEIFMEDLSIAQKISLLGRAELAIGVFGSGMVNLIFANAAITTVTIVPEIMGYNVDPLNYARPTHRSHLFYAECIVSEDEALRSDIFIDCGRFDAMLRSIIG